MKFGKVNAAVRVQNVFFRAHIYNLSDNIPVLIDLEEAALQRHRKLVNQGSVHIFALRHMKARLFHRPHYERKPCPHNQQGSHARHPQS